MMGMRLLLLLWLLAGLAEATRGDTGSLNRVLGCDYSPFNFDFKGGAEVSLAGIVVATVTDAQRLPIAYNMILRIPGVSRVDMEVSGSILSVSGLQENENHLWEKLFAWKFHLPPHVDAQGIRLELQRGLPLITLPILPLESQSMKEPEKLPPTRLRAIGWQCSAENVMNFSSLTGSVRWDESEPEVEMVVEMPGVESAQVEVECRQGTMGSDNWWETPACLVSVRGVFEEEAYESELKWRGRSLYLRLPVAVQKSTYYLYFLLPGVDAENSTYSFSDGFLRFQLRQLPPAPGIWASVAGFAWKLFQAAVLIVM